MDSLTIQDGFTPYYAGRKPFAVPEDRKVEPGQARLAREVQPARPPAATPRSADVEGGTEH